MRPLPTSPVGRTMIAPPLELESGVVCTVEDIVHLFGCEFSIEATPFISQDAQFSRCSHSAMWMVLYHAHLLYRAPRRLPSEIHDATVGGDGMGRYIPSGGLSPSQLLHGLERMGMSPMQVTLPSGRRSSRRSERTSLFSIIGRYLNSDMPPIVYSESHAWVIVGYLQSGPGHDDVHLYRHDDARGPYLRVDDPWREADSSYKPWLAAMPPLPQKVYLTGERAELIARDVLRRALTVANDDARRLLDGRDLTLRSYAALSTTYKAGCEGRLPGAIADAYRLAQWPRYIWIVEAHDERLVATADPSCVGEVIVDSTAHHLEDDEPALAVLAFHVGGDALLMSSDHETLTSAEAQLAGPYRTGCRAAARLRRE
jgi:hypothetical protein